MRTTNATARWGLLALLALVASVGCHDTMLPDEAKEEDVHHTHVFTVSEELARTIENMDHCAMEKNRTEQGDSIAPWLSYCDNPRPVMRGLITTKMALEENDRLKTEWEEKHGKTPVRGGVK